MAVTNITTAKQLVRLTLINTTAITDMVDERVMGEFPVDPDARTQKFPVVVVDFFSGRRNVSSTYQEANCHVYCFSRKSSDEVAELYDLCSNALHMQLLKQDGIEVGGYAEETARTNEGWDVNARCHVAWGRFKVRLGGSAS